MKITISEMRKLFEESREAEQRVDAAYARVDAAYAENDKLREMIAALRCEVAEAKQNQVRTVATSDVEALVDLLLHRPAEKINAIKFIRQITGLGLKESKDAYEWAANGLKQAPLDAQFPGDRTYQGGGQYGVKRY